MKQSLLLLLPARPLNRKKVHVKLNSTAPVGPSWRHLTVGPIPPADWGTRSTRSHLGKRPEREILVLVDRGVGPGVRPVKDFLHGGAPRSGTGLPERGWGPRGPGTAPPRRAKSLSKAGTDPVWRPLSCPCVAIAALSPITVLRLDVWRVVMHLRGRSAGAVWGGFGPSAI
jgi:hypothetical protein